MSVQEAVLAAKQRLAQMRRVNLPPLARAGRVSQVIGLLIETDGPDLQIGDLCELGTGVLAQCVGFREGRMLLMPFDEVEGMAPGARAVALGRRLLAPCGQSLLGRVIDGLGRVIDGGPALQPEELRPTDRAALAPMARAPIEQPLPVGVRAIDGCLSCGRGQRLGLFAGSGVGKSTLLGMLARGTAADVNVIALVGERGREVGEFLRDDLGEEGLRRSVVVVATSDQPALARIQAALTATTIAEHFRDSGCQVLMLMDSLTRYAMAMREVGLARGEPPTSRGYTPSVFAALPRLLERCGSSQVGGITGFYTVLVEGDDMNEPIADAARSILDGHVVLSRALAEVGQYPAIDILQSVSRLMPRLVDAEHLAAAQSLRTVLATHRQAADLIDIGAYRAGTNPEIDRAVALIDPVRAFLRQQTQDRSTWEQTRAALTAAVQEVA
ncbi:MAG TPA: FliI/YscN family ATPase [Bacillota bacterium]|nr:FliI/YscN family ATPase [Bacillota bacterium]